MKVIFTPEFEKSLKRMIWRQRLAKFNPAEYKRQIKWFLQRGKRGYSDSDLWGAYYHIATTVKGFCETYGDNKGMGYPMGLTPIKWKNILKEIEWLMDEVLNDDTPVEVMISGRYKKRRKKAEALFGEYWQNLWD